MKLRYKTLIINGFTWFFFASFLLITWHFSFFNIILPAFAFFLITWLFSYTFIIKRIEKFNQDLIKTTAENSVTKIETINDPDEITTIVKNVNQILLSLKQSRESLETMTVSTHDKSLSTDNTRLEVSNAISSTSLGHYDQLTSLPNSVFFNEILNKTLNHARRHKKSCALLMIEVQSFQNIAKQFGQMISDQVIIEIAHRLTTTLRSEDILARLSTDQFIVLINDIDKAKFASTVAEKLLNACSKIFKIGQQEFNFSINIGICIYPHDGSSLEELFTHVESALDIAKKIGSDRGSYYFYSAEMNIESRKFIKFESALRNALKYKELVLYYQPKLDLKKGRINGIEALPRWNHPELGIVYPSEFIPLAEEIGLVMNIGQWAIHEACRINKYWQDEGYTHMTMALNISPIQFHHPDLVPMLEKALAQTGLNPKYLELEINEQTVMKDIEMADKILNKIKMLGVQISLDHFGTGYTSISHLKRFPINAVKISQSYIKGIPLNPDDNAITSALISLVHNLGLKVVAEGVETAEQVQYLAAQNCDIVQGYFFSQPLPAEKIVDKFAKLRDEVLV